MKFRVLSIAIGEAIAAALWYEDRRPGLADEFQSQLQRTYELIRTNPYTMPTFPSYSGTHKVRRCLMHHFPYAVIYLCRPDETVVVAIAHTHRRPFYWVDRLF